jgi:hypothetical protein
MEEFKKFLRVVGIAIYALLTIATCVAVWVSKAEPSVKIFAGLMFAANGFVIYRFVRQLKIEREEEAKKAEDEFLANKGK